MARSESAPILASLCFILVINAIAGLPRRWYGDSDNPITDITTLKSYQPKTSDYLNTQRKITYGTQVDEVASRTDGKIIFPSDDTDIRQPQPYLPNLKPTCENLTFCEYTPNYPNDFVETALRMNKDLKLFSGIDLVPDVIHRVNAPPEDTPLCESYEKVVYPKVAQSKDKEWLFVVNQGDFTQGVRVETCGKENSACNLIDGFAEGYKTTCKQKYIYRQLVAVSSVGQIKPEMFRFPASCCCHIKFTGNPLVRIAINASNKAVLPTSKVQTK